MVKKFKNNIREIASVYSDIFKSKGRDPYNASVQAVIKSLSFDKPKPYDANVYDFVQSESERILMDIPKSNFHHASLAHMRRALANAKFAPKRKQLAIMPAPSGIVGIDKTIISDKKAFVESANKMLGISSPFIGMAVDAVPISIATAIRDDYDKIKTAPGILLKGVHGLTGAVGDFFGVSADMQKSIQKGTSRLLTNTLQQAEDMAGKLIGDTVFSNAIQQAKGLVKKGKKQVKDYLVGDSKYSHVLNKTVTSILGGLDVGVGVYSKYKDVFDVARTGVETFVPYFEKGEKAAGIVANMFGLDLSSDNISSTIKQLKEGIYKPDDDGIMYDEHVAQLKAASVEQYKDVLDANDSAILDKAFLGHITNKVDYGYQSEETALANENAYRAKRGWPARGNTDQAMYPDNDDRWNEVVRPKGTGTFRALQPQGYHEMHLQPFKISDKDKFHMG